MRIAQITSNAEAVPPKKYGGTERVVHALTEELVKRGHEVTLFASGDSETSARLIPTSPINLREMKIGTLYSNAQHIMYAIGLGYSMQDEFDIIHDHNYYVSLPAAHLAKVPVLMTLHGPFNNTLQKMAQVMNKPFINSISDSQIRNKIGINYTRTIYNGLPMEHYPFKKKHKGYLLNVGRISIEKGTHHAIEVAQQLNMPLIIAAKLDEVDKKYFHQYVEPYLSKKHINWVGEVDEKERNKLMSEAMALLHPVYFREPFGLVMIEALACGTPVIGFNRGSVPEIVQEAKTGFVVSDVEEMIDAVQKIDQIDRAYCRKYALEHFDAKTMTDKYEKLYEEIINMRKEGTVRHSEPS